MKKLSACLVFAATAVSAQSVYPIVTCVNPVGGGRLEAIFGYVNPGDPFYQGIDSVDNAMSPPPYDQDQTTYFQQGLVRNAFGADFYPGSTLTWTVLGNSATATNDPTTYCPGTGNSGTAGLACWDTNGNGACDPSEDVNGDGTCNALDCIGRMGPAGPPGPQGPPGATGAQGSAGASLQAAIQVVTNATASSTATASCQASQTLINGGGMCTVPNTNSISGRMASSQPSGSTGWAVSCSTGQATAVALCAPGQ
jgi:hypothetical protein